MEKDQLIYLSCFRINGERQSSSIGHYHGVGHLLIINLKGLEELLNITKLI